MSAGTTRAPRQIDIHGNVYVPAHDAWWCSLYLESYTNIHVIYKAYVYNSDNNPLMFIFSDKQILVSQDSQYRTND